jgi:hypothetical protein
MACGRVCRVLLGVRPCVRVSACVCAHACVFRAWCAEPQPSAAACVESAHTLLRDAALQAARASNVRVLCGRLAPAGRRVAGGGDKLERHACAVRLFLTPSLAGPPAPLIVAAHVHVRARVCTVVAAREQVCIHINTDRMHPIAPCVLCWKCVTLALQQANSSSPSE